MRTWIGILTAFLLLNHPGTPIAQSAPLEKVTIALTSETPTMDPHVDSNFIGSMIWRWTYDTLISSETGSGKVAPWLAERWERLTPTQVKFWLRKDARFTDGTPVTAQAVKYSVERILDPALKSRQRPYFNEFERVEVIDDHSFIWHSKVADNGLFNRLLRWAHVVSPKTKGMEQAAFAQSSFGSGPYILKSWTKGQRMILEANPTWWGKKQFPDMPKTVILRAITENSTRVKALLVDEIDIILGVPPHMIPQVQQNPAKVAASVPGVRIMFLNFDTLQGGPLADVNVRKAINHAIDVESIRRTILENRAESIGQIYHPWNYAGYNPAKKWYEFDLAKAKAALKASPYAGGFKATVYSPIGRYAGDKEACEAIVGMLKKVDIDTTCRPMNYALHTKIRRAYQEKKEKEPAIFVAAFGNSGGDPAIVARAVIGCQGAWSFQCSPDIDEAVDKAAATSDPEEQHAAFERLTATIKERALLSILYRTHDIYAYSKALNFIPRHDEALYPWEISAK